MSLKNAIILFPHGLPRTEEGQRELRGKLYHCGGDISALRPRSWKTTEDLVAAMKAISAHQDIIVVMTDVLQLERNVLWIRETACNFYPFLRRALWVIFLEDHGRRHVFMDARTKLAWLQEGELQDAPIVTSKGGLGFLVLTTTEVEISHLKSQVVRLLERVRELRTGSSSSTWRAVTPQKTK